MNRVSFSLNLQGAALFRGGPAHKGGIMKPRRVAIMIEAETDIPLADLRSMKGHEKARIFSCVTGNYSIKVLQVQANIIKPENEKK